MLSGSQDSSDRSRSRSRSRSGEEVRNKKRLRRPLKPQQRFERSFAESVADQISNSFIRFFDQIDHNRKLKKGFIMSPSYRNKLQKQQLKYLKIKTKTRDIPKIQWRSEAHWDFTEQTTKINQIFKRKQLPLAEEHIKFLKQIFIEVSTIFGDESTAQLYELLMEVIELYLRHKADYSAKARTFFVDELRKSSKYIFFNYKFSELTDFKLKRQRNYDEVYEALGNTIVQQLHLAISSQIDLQQQ